MINYKEVRTIKFEPVEHKYTDERGNEYTSATTLIGKYKKPFDKEYWLMWTTLKANNYILKYSDDNVAQHLIAIKKGHKFRTYPLKYLYDNAMSILNLPTEAVQKEWIQKTEIACAKGNVKHDFLEDEINKFSFTKDVQLDKLKKAQSNTLYSNKVLNRKALENSEIKRKHPSIYKTLVGYINQGWTIHAEKRVYSAYHLVAGMIDVLLVKGDRFIILDWKTNKKALDFESGYYKKDNKGRVSKEWVSKGDKLLYPINNVDDCKGMVYTLQLSLYAYILELWGFKCEGLILCHIMDKESQPTFGIVNEDIAREQEFDIKMYDIKYLKSDIHRMITHHVKTR